MILSGILAARSGAAYYAPAVHFDGMTWLINAALASSDNDKASMSVWLRTNLTVETGAVWQAGDSSWLFPYTDTGTVFQWVGFGQDGGHTVEILNGTSYTQNVWEHWLASVDLNGGSPIEYLYKTDVSVGQPPVVNATPTSIAFNGRFFGVGASSAGGADALVFDVADLWVAPGVSLISGAGIPEATRRKFIDANGKPVYLGANGGLPTGTAPAVFLSGAAASFATNLGTGGAFTTTGTLTAASTSPSD